MHCVNIGIDEKMIKMTFLKIAVSIPTEKIHSRRKRQAVGTVH